MAQPVVEVSEKNFDQFIVSVGNGVVTAFPTPTNGVQPEFIFVQAPTTNTVSVVVGESTILANLSAGGFEFPPGANFTLPVNVASELKCIAGAASQKLLVTYIWGAN